LHQQHQTAITAIIKGIVADADQRREAESRTESRASTNRIAELCAKVTETHLIETADDIKKTWLKGKKHIGVTSGASTAEETVTEVMKRLKEMSSP
jgi:4-hydroxy-3-methylbut-2-enyl diphosphate reductase